MMKYLFLLILTLSVSAAFSQAEKNDDRVVAAQFRNFHNAGKADSIYSLFSAEMQQALPLEKAREFLGGLKVQAGAIEKMDFYKYDGPYASYKTMFEKGTFAVNIALGPDKKIGGFFVKPMTDETLPRPERNVTKLQLPFKEEWTVMWGGDTKALNYHVENTAQKNAFDMVITNARDKSFKTDGKANGDYYAFGKALYAPSEGEVVEVIDGVADNKPGKLNEIEVTGNTVVLKTANNEYLYFAHFKQQSIKVKKGQFVKTGELLGLCGNSGRSSEPHLHFHIQNTLDIAAGTGIKAYFYEIKVNGKVMRDYSPVQKDKISNVN
jgi:hypothetical protein